MIRRRVILIAALLFGLLSSNGSGQARSLKGAWRVAEVTSVQGERNGSPEPGLYIFTDRYYSIQWLTRERSAYPQNPTEQDRLAAWAPLIAHSGTYAVNGTILSTKAIVAKTPSVMTGAGGTAELKFEGADIVHVTATNPTGATIKLSRVE
jgi:hypothetical protein